MLQYITVKEVIQPLRHARQPELSTVRSYQLEGASNAVRMLAKCLPNTVRASKSLAGIP